MGRGGRSHIRLPDGLAQPFRPGTGPPAWRTAPDPARSRRASANGHARHPLTFSPLFTFMVAEMPSTALPTFADVEAAAGRLAGHAVVTPLLASLLLNDLLGGRLLVKAEVLQRTGAFKFRGAYNKLMSIPVDKRSAGVVAFSSGNHAQGVAAAAKLLGIPATIVMPSDAPLLKRERTAALGARVILYDRDKEDREGIARAIVDKSGATLVPPYNDPFIIAGQGTLGREIVDDLAKLNLEPELVVIGASGGGLAAGTALGIKATAPDADIWTAEPEGFDDTLRSFKSGKIESNTRMSGTICDALMSPCPGDI